MTYVRTTTTRVLAKVSEGFGVLSLGAAILGGVALGPALVLGAAGVLLLFGGVYAEEISWQEIPLTPAAGGSPASSRAADAGRTGGTIARHPARVRTQDGQFITLPTTTVITPPTLRISGLPTQVVSMIKQTGQAPDDMPWYLYVGDTTAPPGLIWIPDGAQPSLVDGEWVWQLNVPITNGVPAVGWNTLTGAADRRAVWPL